MFIRDWRFLAIILTALTTGLAFAHALELPAKLGYDAALYVTLAHSLYGGFGSVGAVVDVGALLPVPGPSRGSSRNDRSMEASRHASGR